MSDHPTTFGGESAEPGIDWGAHATIHCKTDGGGVLDGFKALHRGTLGEMVGMIAKMSPGDRTKYVVQKAGDHRMEVPEIMALAARRDFPG